MATPRIDPERAALVLTDAFVMGDVAAGKKWGLSDRAVRGYRKRLETDEVLAAHFERAKAQFVSDWSGDAKVFMSKSMKKLVELVEVAYSPDHIGDIAKAVQVVGDLLISHEVLNGSEDSVQGGAAPAAPGQTSRPLVG